MSSELEDIEIFEGEGFIEGDIDYDEDEFYEGGGEEEYQEYIPGFKELQQVSATGPCAPVGPGETLASKIARTDREKQIYLARASLNSRLYLDFADGEKSAACLLIDRLFPETDIDFMNARTLAAAAMYVIKYGKKPNASKLKKFVDQAEGLKDVLEKVSRIDLIRYLIMLEHKWKMT